MRTACGGLVVPVLLTALQACSPGADRESAAGNTSVPCAGLTSSVEVSICEDEELRAMDGDASRLYQRVLARAAHDEKTALRAAHAAWRRDLYDCEELDRPLRRACIDALYNARIVALSRRLREQIG